MCKFSNGIYYAASFMGFELQRFVSIASTRRFSANEDEVLMQQNWFRSERD